MKKTIYFLVSYNIEGYIIGNVTIGVEKEKLSNYSEEEFLKLFNVLLYLEESFDYWAGIIDER